MSDQDFFFEDDEKPAAKPDNKGKKPGTQSSRPASKGNGSQKPASSGGGDGQTVTMTMAILFAVIGVLLGVVIGLFIGNAVTPATSGVTSPGQQTAPALSNEQLNSGELPAGHPSIAPTATAPSTTTSPTK